MPPLRQPARAPATAPPARPPPKKPAAAPSPAAALQSRIGNGGMRRMLDGQRAAKRPAAVPKPAAKREPAAAAAQGKESKAPAPEAGEAGAAPDHGRLKALKTQVVRTAQRQRQPADSRALVARTRESALAPGPEATSKAATATLTGLEETGAQTEPFDTAAFKKALRDKLLQKMPDGKTGDDAEQALRHETGAEVAADMKGELAATQAKTVGNLPAAAATPPDPSQHSPEAPPGLAATPPGERPATPGAAGAVPERLPDAALDTQADRNEADAQLASENLGQDQLKQSNEPSFVDAAETRDAAERHSEAGPAAVRAAEAQARGAAGARGAGLLATGVGGLFGDRAAGFLRALGQQDAAKAKEEAQRRQIAEDLDGIQRKTRTDVEAMLAAMEKAALDKFNLGLEAALAAFDAQREKTEAAIRKVGRDEALSHGNVIGAVISSWGDLDEDEVEYTIRAARRAYNEAIDRAIDDVANLVGPALADVKKRIEQGKTEAADYVARLHGSVAEIAAGELERINGEFDTLSADVDSRRDGLINKLNESYTAANKAVEERAQAFRDANKSWWQKLKEKVRGVIRAIIQIKDMFASVLARLAGVVGAILSDPIGFLGNLIAGVKRGLDNFANNFLAHLKAGFFEWLFGETAKAGIVMPKTFDAAGIFGLIAGVLGLTVANVRARAVAKVGGPVVAALEAGAGILLTLKEKGLAGLWDMLMEKLDSLKESVLEQIQSMLLIEVVKAGIAWVIGLLNPASAFIKACKAIYEIVMFFVNNGKRIMDFVNAVIDSIGAIAKGQLDAAATKVEDSLARMIPLIIGFLASLLGLGSITDKVKKIIARLQAPVNKAIDWVIDKAVLLAKKGAAAVKSLIPKKEKERKEDQTPSVQDPAKAALLERGLAALQAEEDSREQGGLIDKAASQAAADRVRAQHPVFKSLTVVDGGDSWDFAYVVNPPGRHKGGGKLATITVIETAVNYTVAEVSGLPPVPGSSGWKDVEDAAKAQMRESILPAITGENVRFDVNRKKMPTKGALLTPERIEDAVPAVGDPVKLFNEPSIPEDPAKKREKVGASKPDLLAVSRPEIITVEITMKTSWTTTGVSSAAAGQRIQKKSQAANVMVNLQPFLKRNPTMKVRVLFAVTGKPDQAARDEMDALATGQFGAQISAIQWLVLPSS